MFVAYCRLCRHCRNFILRAVATFWAMSLVRIYPGRASNKLDEQFCFNTIYFQHMVGKKNAEDALNALDDSEFSGTHIQVQVR